MAFTPKGKELKDLDLDDLLSKLSEAELEELQSELIDADDSTIPPSDHCLYKVSKEATGPFDRERLLEYLENKARNEKDGEDVKQSVKENKGAAKHEPCKTFMEEPLNTTDVDVSLTRIRNNDPSLKELNLNNIKDISIDQLREFGTALATNTNLEKLHLANTGSNDKVAKAIAAGLSKNSHLKLLDLESNYICAIGIIELLKAINKNQVMTKFRVLNQRPPFFGVKNEMEIARLVRENTSLLQFEIFMEVYRARDIVTWSVKRNNNNLRPSSERMGEKILVPSTDDTPNYLKDKSKA